eukprot:jgi/Hompol1/5771/HPOL_001965-RA
MAFSPVRTGEFRERLIIRKELHVIRVELTGTAVAPAGSGKSGTRSRRKDNVAARTGTKPIRSSNPKQ